ncbi:glycosyltransferase [Aquiflexum lacus]|uniref:glycosyltransferase n=1 Tax=Aquiflexum lacus TaxID=2483805 RepID=UPI001894CCE5|nr:glycosyltransferase [Aquiflexum lacus]
MKILRIVSELDFGGVEQVLAISVPYLVQTKGIEVQVVVLGKGGRISEGLIQDGFSVIVLNQATRIPNIKLVFQLKNLIKNEKPDVVHCQGSEANFHGLWAASMAGVKIKIGEEIGLPNHHSFWKYVFKWIYQKADRVIAISEAVKNYIIELGEVESEKVEVIYNPVDLARIEKVENLSRRILGEQREIPRELGEGFRFAPTEKVGKQNDGNNDSDIEKSFLFITTCRLVPIKNLERLIEAFAKLRQCVSEKHIELWIVGEGPLKESLVQQVNQLEIQASIKFLGFQENVFQFLEQADIFVLPSLREGSSVSLAEAMSYGLPSIVTEIGGAREILGDIHSGLLVDPFSTDAIFSAMLSMCKLSEDEIKEMGKKAIVASQRFSIETYAEELLEVYKG